jgi:protein SCO1
MMNRGSNLRITARRRALALSCALLTGACVSCSPAQDSGSTNRRTFEVKGKVISIAADAHSVVIQHEDIPGFMSAMTMSFPVKDPSLLRALVPNDLVKFELTVTEEDSWISRIEKTGHIDEPGGQGDTKRSEPQSILSPGQVAPPFSLKDQDGRAVSLSHFQGKPVALTFIFTRCPLPDYCPRFTNNFVRIQKDLAPRFKDGFHLLSISIDPDHDTPKILRFLIL